MGLEKEALEFLRDQAIAAHTAVIKPPAEPQHIYFTREADGALTQRKAEVAPRSYFASSLRDLAELYGVLTEAAKRRITDGADLPSSIAFIGNDFVQIVLDEQGTRRERLSFKLTVTRAFTALRRLATGPEAMDQNALIELLRIELHGCVDRATIQLLRSLKNTASTSGESTITASTRALSRSVVVEASAGGDEVPDEIVANTPIYEQFAHGDGCKRHPIRCGLVMNVETFEFTMIPLAGELEQAYLTEEQRIAEELRFLVEKNNCTVVCGLP